MNGHTTLIGDHSRAGQGADEHASERTLAVRERARAGGNAGMRRMGDR
jgi:hypothetical protein